jgi:tRNA threonylcarbamoyladenosine biosynthesis protein TsaB
MPNLLYIDTSASKATVALSQEGRITAVRTHDNANEQAAVLNIMINNVLEEASCNLDQVDALCVCAGPGSYTGLRVGLSTAKGIAFP